MTGTQVNVGTRSGKNTILLQLDPSLSNPEGYVLQVTPEGISLRGATEAAVFLGIQTLYKSLPQPVANA